MEPLEECYHSTNNVCKDASYVTKSTVAFADFSKPSDLSPAASLTDVLVNGSEKTSDDEKTLSCNKSDVSTVADEKPDISSHVHSATAVNEEVVPVIDTVDSDALFYPPDIISSVKTDSSSDDMQHQENHEFGELEQSSFVSGDCIQVREHSPSENEFSGEFQHQKNGDSVKRLDFWPSVSPDTSSELAAAPEFDVLRPNDSLEADLISCSLSAKFPSFSVDDKTTADSMNQLQLELRDSHVLIPSVSTALLEKQHSVSNCSLRDTGGNLNSMQSCGLNFGACMLSVQNPLNESRCGEHASDSASSTTVLTEGHGDISGVDIESKFSVAAANFMLPGCEKPELVEISINKNFASHERFGSDCGNDLLDEIGNNTNAERFNLSSESLPRCRNESIGEFTRNSGEEPYAPIFFNVVLSSSSTERLSSSGSSSSGIVSLSSVESKTSNSCNSLPEEKKRKKIQPSCSENRVRLIDSPNRGRIDVTTVSNTGSMHGSVSSVSSAVTLHSSMSVGHTSNPSLSASSEAPQNIALGPPLSSNINLPITQLGKVAPNWLPDSEASKCMQCEMQFSFTRRRHHCRACGKIFCSNCSSLKAAIQYLEGKENRVCSKCYQDLIRAQYYQQSHNKLTTRPNPNNPSEYCSVVSPLLQVQSLNPVPLPSIMVPTTGVLRKQGSARVKPESKQVMFADGIRPGGDLMETDGVGSSQVTTGHAGRRTKKPEKPVQGNTSSDSVSTKVKSLTAPKQNTCLIPAYGGLPPVVISTSGSSSKNKDYSLMDSPTVEFVLYHLCKEEQPVTFVIDTFLAVIVSFVHLDCCLNRTCWSFTTKGMRSVGQDEIIILLECLPDERIFPTDVFHHLHSIYQRAGEGTMVTPLGHTALPPGAFNGLDNAGFLFIRQTFQCLEKLILPEPPYLFGILLQKWEMSWAKVFPMRLLFRLGAEFRYYPCPLMGVRNRQPVYGEIGHTVMNLLADFHNYQYMVSHIDGLVIHLEDKRTSVKIPTNKYDAIMKVLNSADDHVLALGADFSTLADSHLVCLQNEDGNYQTQAINIQNKTRKVTGASFVVFNGALKPSSGCLAKSSIVEDGVMIQVTPTTMAEIKQSWKDMRNYTVLCNLNADDVVSIEWVDDREIWTLNSKVRSPVDGLSLQGNESRRIHSTTDFVNEGHTIRWTEIFLLQNELNESTNMNRLLESMAQAACIALVPHLPLLADARMTKIGLRIAIGSAEVSIKAGAERRSLPDFCIYDLEEKLMPLLRKYSSSFPRLSPSSSSSYSAYQGNLVVELVLLILHLSSTVTATPSIVVTDS